VNAMLLNEFLKEHRKVEELEATFAQQQEDFQLALAQQRKDFESTVSQQQRVMKALTASLKEQASKIQKVTRLRRVELSKAAPQMVADNQ
jgi:hypothetical protein